MNLPFLRWPGGKRWLAKKISTLLKKNIEGRYYEPFLGAGAMFFSIAPKIAVLSDINDELIDTFKTVSEYPCEILSKIKSIPVTEEKYYEIRSWAPEDPLDKCVRFIYLNRTCYGGIFRTNKKGVFNVPYGGGSRTPRILWEKNLINNAAQYIRESGVQLISCDFEESINRAGTGDLIYCDPVYSSKRYNQFVRYNSKYFSWDEQIRLHEVVTNASERGATVIISNIYCEEVEELYQDAHKLKLYRNKSIGNPSLDGNQNFEYLLLYNYDDYLCLDSLEEQLACIDM